MARLATDGNIGGKKVLVGEHGEPLTSTLPYCRWERNKGHFLNRNKPSNGKEHIQTIWSSLEYKIVKECYKTSNVVWVPSYPVTRTKRTPWSVLPRTKITTITVHHTILLTSSLKLLLYMKAYTWKFFSRRFFNVTFAHCALYPSIKLRLAVEFTTKQTLWVVVLIVYNSITECDWKLFSYCGCLPSTLSGTLQCRLHYGNRTFFLLAFSFSSLFCSRFFFLASFSSSASVFSCSASVRWVLCGLLVKICAPVILFFLFADKMFAAGALGGR